MEKFELMAKHGIRSTSNSMIGIPGEYEEDFFETVKLNKAIYKMFIQTQKSLNIIGLRT